MSRWPSIGLVLAAACGGETQSASPSSGGTQAGTTVLLGSFRGPYTILGFCGNCETQVRFFDEAAGRELNVVFPKVVPGQALVQAQTRCRAIGRFVDHAGSCGDGQCRSFVVEAVEPP